MTTWVLLLTNCLAWNSKLTFATKRQTWFSSNQSSLIPNLQSSSKSSNSLAVSLRSWSDWGPILNLRPIKEMKLKMSLMPKSQALIRCWYSTRLIMIYLQRKLRVKLTGSPMLRLRLNKIIKRCKLFLMSSLKPLQVNKLGSVNEFFSWTTSCKKNSRRWMNSVERSKRQWIGQFVTSLTRIPLTIKSLKPMIGGLSWLTVNFKLLRNLTWTWMSSCGRMAMAKHRRNSLASRCLSWCTWAFARPSKKFSGMITENN